VSGPARCATISPVRWIIDGNNVMGARPDSGPALNSTLAGYQQQRQANYDQHVRRHLTRNIVAQITNGMFAQTGFRLVQAPTFLPAYLFALSGSDFMVGLSRSLQAAGTVASPVIGASMIGHRDRILGTTLTVGALMRLQILGMSIAGFTLAATETLYAIMAMMLLMGFFQGMYQVANNSLRAKVIPVNRRGMVTGVRNFLAGLSSATVSYVAGAYMIERDVLGNGYAAVFLLAFAVGMAGLFAMAITKEPDAVSVKPRESVGGTLRLLPGLLRDDPAFAKYFFARALASFGRMAMPFYILFAATRMEITGSVLGLLTTVWMITSSVTNIFWGLIADRHGYRIVMIATLALWILSHAQLLFTDDLTGMIVFFVIMGLAQGGFAQASQNMLLEFGRIEDIPLRLAASGTAVNFIGMIGPVMGGVIIAGASYQALFLTCIVLQSIALLMILIWVPEPRKLGYR
jgi:MFS family permease